MLIGPMDIYTSLDKGVIDGWAIAWTGAAAYKLWEVTLYYTEAKAQYTPMFIAMNLDKWNSLPRNVQKDMESISGAAGAKFVGENWYKSALAAIQQVKDANREIIALSPEELARWRVLSEPIINDFVAGLDAKGLAGTKVLNEIRKYMKEHK